MSNRPALTAAYIADKVQKHSLPNTVVTIPLIDVFNFLGVK